MKKVFGLVVNKKKKFVVVAILFFLFVGVTAFAVKKYVIKTYNNDFGIAHLTKENVASFPDTLKNLNYRAPRYKQENLMKDVPSSKALDNETGQMKSVPVWDSWPVQNPDGSVADFHGYRLVVGMTSIGGRSDSSAHLALYAQKLSADSNDISSWEYLGNVFDKKAEGSKNDAELDKLKGEWSGSTVMFNKKDNTLRMFYTNAMITGSDNQAQALATAQITIDPKQNNNWDSGLVINHNKTSDHKTIFKGDGEIYQQVAQAMKKDGDFYNSFAMRDSHFIEENGKYYLVFETNTASKYGSEGENNLNNQAYYGNKKFFKKERERILKSKNSDEYKRTFYGNAAIGRIELNKDFTVKKVMKPVLTANATHDVIERPTVFKYKGKWYLFTCLTAPILATDKPNQYRNQSYMLGYVSDTFDGKYKPLNGNGMVLSSSEKIGSPNYTYSFLALKPKNDKGNIVVTSFTDNKTFAPSYIMKINGDKTKIINDKLLGQGALVDNGHYTKTVPQSQYEG